MLSKFSFSFVMCAKASANCLFADTSVSSASVLDMVMNARLSSDLQHQVPPLV